MNYEGTIIRPPSESDSIILQVSVGCSYNKCSFCGTYKGVDFRLKDESEIDRDLKFAARYCRNQKRVFLCDGDALIISQKRLVKLFGNIRAALPWVNRISLYANARAIRSKSVSELSVLKDLGLDRVYFGLESGDDNVLHEICKGETAKTQTSAATKIVQAGLFLSVTVLLGIAGTDHGIRHARLTAEIINQIKPSQIAALTVMPLANTSLGRKVENRSFSIPGPEAIAMELRELLTFLTLDRVQFMANHASNYVVISGRLQRDKQKLLDLINAAITSQDQYVPENRRLL